jgi:signal transduction histidine kinase/ligand-binding sensor domain-containing protein/DNA-binding response OmpR family regulator
MKRYVLLVLFVLCVSLVAHSVDFRHLSTSNGLSDGEITSIVQDSVGNMWFATYTGLIKYDGAEFQLFRPELGNPYSIPDKKVGDLFVDSNNNLWIASTRKLSYYNQVKNEFREIIFEGFAVEELNIKNLSEYQNHLIIATDNGLFVLSLNNLSHSNLIARKPVFKLFGKVIDNYSSYSYAFHNQFFIWQKYSLKESVFLKAKFEFDDGKSIIVLNPFLELDYEMQVNTMEYFDSDLYIGTTNGLLIYSIKQNKFIRKHYFKGIDILKVFLASDHKVYCSTLIHKLLVLDLHTGTTSSYDSNPAEKGSLLSNNILTFFEDHTGNLWIGHQGQGISILNLYSKKFHTFRYNPFRSGSLSRNVIMCFSESKDEYLIGTRDGGLNIINKDELLSENPVFKVLRIPSSNITNRIGVWDIKRESDSLFWLGTDIGLFRLERKYKKWKISPFGEKSKINGVIWRIFIDKNKNIWCGGYDRGLIFIPATNRNKSEKYYQFTFDSKDSTTLSNNYNKEIMVDSNDRFWIGTVNGLNCLTTEYNNLNLTGDVKPDLKFKRYKALKADGKSLNNNDINSIFENFDGKLWIGTLGGGLNIFDPEKEEFSYITKSDGLPSNDMYGILSDKFGNLWISTINGLVLFNQLQANKKIIVFDQFDGIQGDVFMFFSYFKSNSGLMFFGGDNGFTCFYPNEIKMNTIPPKVAFSKLIVDNKVISIGDTLSHNFYLRKSLNKTEKIVLPYNHNTFSIGVSVLHFLHPEKNSIYYKLEGYNSKWQKIPASEKQIQFFNIPHGNYALKVRGLSSDNEYSVDTKILKIVILPAWYNTWYMRLIYILIAVFLIVNLFFFLIKRQKLIHQEQLNDITIKNNENKMIFFTNIAHELRTPLSLIIAPVEDIIANYTKENAKFKNHIQIIYRNSNYLLSLLNQIIDFRKLNVGKLKLDLQKVDLVRLIKDVVINFKGYEFNRNINLFLKFPSDSIFVTIDVQKIEVVMYNLFSNAFKHTPENSSIVVSISSVSGETGTTGADKNNFIRITVFNEGDEIPAEHISMIFERFYKVDEYKDGAGIGLAFSKSLVEMHNGVLSVESVKGKGVEFHIDIPYEGVLEETINTGNLITEKIVIQQEHFIPVLKNEKPDVDKSTILIVEDNSEMRYFLSNILQPNYNCILASDGAEGWRKVQKNKPVLVVSDIIMPKMTGMQLCEKIKKTDNTCHIPVILLTAKNAAEYKIEGYKTGADAYVSKPFDIDILFSQIERLIKNRLLIEEKYRTQNFMVEIESTNTKDEEFIQNVKAILDENIANTDFNVSMLSKEINISPAQLYRRLKALSGYSPVEFIRLVRLQKAYSLLNSHNKTVKEICYLTGFNNLSYFIKCFKEQFGETPAHFRDVKNSGILNPENGNEMG